MPRTVVAKAECHAGGTNLRFVVTNLPGVTTDADGERVYDGYCLRGESEHRMDQLKNGLSAGRLSCHRFRANAFRPSEHVAAYNLLNALRDHPSIPGDLRVGRPDAWRTRVVKVAAEVVATTRRVVVRLAAQWPHWDAYRAVAARANGVPVHARLTPRSPGPTVGVRGRSARAGPGRVPDRPRNDSAADTAPSAGAALKNSG